MFCYKIPKSAFACFYFTINDYNTKKGLTECIGINLNEEVKLKSIKDFRYFSLKFEPFESVKKQLMLTQYNDDFNFIILDITKAKSRFLMQRFHRKKNPSFEFDDIIF